MKIKHIVIVFLMFLSVGCDSDSALNCFQTAGPIVQETVSVAPFTKINVEERVQLLIGYGPEQKVVIETGENLLNDIEVSVNDGRLTIINNNGCNLVREYGITKAWVTSPNISEIRNSSGLTVESTNTLTFPELELISEDRNNEDEFHIDGDFNLSLSVDRLSIISSGISNFFLRGTANRASIGLYSGDSRVEAGNFIVQDLWLFHRSTNQMIVQPIQSIKGEIRSVGDVVSKNRPPIVEVAQFFRGRLIFE
jgi:hypothetical protein